MTSRLVLASGSPRRRQILASLGVDFDVLAAAVDEQPLPKEEPAAAARRVALAKARAVANRVPAAVTLAADTIVVSDGLILGKPADVRTAKAMLRALRGRRHEVITGVAALNPQRKLQHVTATVSQVFMRDYSDAEIAAYVASGEAADKAGAYAVQSESFHPAARVEGCYLNVVGLPLCAAVRALCSAGFALLPAATERIAGICGSCPLRDILARGCPGTNLVT